MVISDPTIDPITGLPLLNPSDVIQQIPLGVQTFPYTDLGATSLPTRGPLYGDDILPVSAFVAGQHPQTGSAQTVETDGNHRLKVDTGGGGGGNAPVALYPYDFSQTTSGSGTSDLGQAGLIGSVIYGITFSYTYDVGAVRSPGQNGYVRVQIATASAPPDNFYLASIAISIPASGTTDRLAGEAHRWFDRGISFPHAFDYGDGHYHILLDEVNINSGNLVLEIWQAV